MLYLIVSLTAVRCSKNILGKQASETEKTGTTSAEPSVLQSLKKTYEQMPESLVKLITNSNPIAKEA